jgi:signal transduction histidine kinase
MKHTLLIKTVCLVLFTVILSAALTALLFRFSGIKNYGEMKISELKPRAEFISSRAADYIQGIITRKDFENIVNYDSRIWDAAPYLYASDGTLFGSITNDELETNTKMIEPYLQTALGGEEVSSVIMMGGTAGVIVGEPITMTDGTVMGAVFLVKPMDELSTAWGSLTSSLPLAMLLVALIVVPVAYIGSRGLTRPLNKMNEAAVAMTNGDFSVRAIEKGDGEVARLGRSLNELSSALSGTINALIFERNRLKSVLDGLLEGVIAVNEAGQVIQSNPASITLMGCANGESIEQSPMYEELHSMVSQVLTDGVSRWTEQSYKEAMLKFTISALNSGGKTEGAIIMIQDVTEAARLEQTRRDYVANVSHELRTPIASIRGLSDALCDGLVKKDSDKLRYYGYIQHEAMRLSRLIDDLLELSRLQSGSVAIAKCKMSVNDLINDVAERYSTIANENGKTLSVSMDEAEHEAYSNPDRCEQVLIALLDNAIKHSTSGDVRLGVDEDENKYTITVSNPGEIADADIDHIFERFYKADRAHTGEGTGLGLAIAKEIMELMGEKIWAESREGTVKFCFTVAKRAAVGLIKN